MREDEDKQIKNRNIIKILKREMGLRYKMVKVVPKQGNSERSLYLRQQFAMKLLSLLKEGKRILNVDQTHINESNYSLKAWQRVHQSTFIK